MWDGCRVGYLEQEVWRQGKREFGAIHPQEVLTQGLTLEHKEDL